MSFARKSAELAPASIRRNISAIRTYFKFLIGDGVVVRDPSERLDTPKKWRTLPEVLTVEEVQRLLASPTDFGFRIDPMPAWSEFLKRAGVGDGLPPIDVAPRSPQEQPGWWWTNSAFPRSVALPEDDQARNRLLFYRRDTGIPKHRVNGNFLVDVPIGKGKRIAGNAGRAVDAVIGGWQVAGNGTLTSRYFQIPTNLWGAQGKIETCGKKYPVQDCRSGVCYDGWLYWNGYIPANRINSVDPRTGRVVGGYRNWTQHPNNPSRVI